MSATFLVATRAILVYGVSRRLNMSIKNGRFPGSRKVSLVGFQICSSGVRRMLVNTKIALGSFVL